MDCSHGVTKSQTRLSGFTYLLTKDIKRRLLLGRKAMTNLESESEVSQSCLTLCNPMDCSLPGFSVHGILQARILEWVAISFSRGSS